MGDESKYLIFEPPLNFKFMLEGKVTFALIAEQTLPDGIINFNKEICDTTVNG